MGEDTAPLFLLLNHPHKLLIILIDRGLLGDGRVAMVGHGEEGAGRRGGSQQAVLLLLVHLTPPAGGTGGGAPEMLVLVGSSAFGADEDDDVDSSPFETLAG